MVSQASATISIKHANLDYLQCSESAPKLHHHSGYSKLALIAWQAMRLTTEVVIDEVVVVELA